MKTKQEAIQEQIDEIMDTFDFERVHRVMVSEDWTWGSGNGASVPDVTQLRIAARERLKSAARDGLSSTGGFTATRDEGVDEGKPWVRLNLSFGLRTFNDGTEYDQ